MPARPSIPLAAVAAVVLGTAQGCAPPPAPPVDEGIPLALAEVRAATLSGLTYDLDLEVPEDRAAPVRGANTLSFVWDDPDGRDLVVDFKDPGTRVREVTVNGAAAAWQPLADHIVVDAAALEAGARNRVRVTFDAGDEALNRSDDFLYTLFVPDRAHFSLPLFDQPDLKARVTLALAVPPGWVAVANGPERDGPPIPEELAGSGLAPAEVGPPGPVGGDGDGPGPARRYRFAATEPIPSYLIAFAAGRFSVEAAERDGRRYRMYHRETDAAKVARNRDDIFDLVARSVAWMEEYTGVPHPFAKHDFVLIPPFQYGGMEHPGSIFYRQSSLMLDASATQRALLGRASLIAHEVAHMWFGDLVTMRWFDDVWTKEVFANFFAAEIVHPSFPEVDHDLRFLLGHHPSAYGVDRTPGANPIRQPLDNLREAGTLYGAIIYQKAPIVMRQLEERVGSDVLRAGLRRYLEEHAYGNATWPDLIAILDRAVDDDLVGWSRVWVEEPGRPVVRVAWEAGGDGIGRVRVAQEDAWDRARVWPQRLTLAAAAPGGSVRRAEIDLAGPAVEDTPWTGGPAPRWILPNAGGLGYGLFELDPEATRALLDDLPTLEPPLLRGAGWLVVRDAMLEGRLSPRRILDRVLVALPDERDELLLGHLLGLVSDIHWRLLSDEERTAVAPRVEDVLARGLAAAATRTARATWFNAWRGMVSTEAGVARLRRIWSGDETVPDLPLSEPDRTAMATELALRGVPDADRILDRQRDEISNPDRRARFDFVRPALSADPEVREAFFASLADEETRAREPWVLAGLQALHHPLRRSHAVRFVAPSLEMVQEIQRTGDIFFPGRWLEATLGGHNTAEAAGAVVSFLAGAPGLPPRLRAKVLQSADGVVRAARLVHGDAPRLPGVAAR